MIGLPLTGQRWPMTSRASLVVPGEDARFTRTRRSMRTTSESLIARMVENDSGSKTSSAFKPCGLRNRSVRRGRS